jgi:hypothetical protein
LDLAQYRSLPPWLFDEAAGGISISGDSGTGKSSLTASIFSVLARQAPPARGRAPVGCTLLDPAGDLARQCKRIALAIPSARKRLFFISPAGMDDLTFPIRPLYVDPTGLSPEDHHDRLTRRVSIAARILLHAWGEMDFNLKPLLMKWTTRLLETVAALGLSFVDAELFVREVGSPLYSILTQAVPDLMARLEYEELADMRAVDRESFIASTKNRFLGLLKNRRVRNVLSGLPTPGASTIRDLIRSGAIIIVDLSAHGKLRPEDQQILANCWLTEILDAVENFEEHERTPHVLLIDELPTFASPPCMEQLAHCLRTCRKTLFRCAANFQGTNFFPDRHEDRTLHAFVGQCGTMFTFRHKNPVDAKFFGEILRLPTLAADLHRPKHILMQDVQFQDGHDLVTLVDEGTSASSTEGQGGGEAWGTNRQDTLTHGTTNTETDTETQGTSEATQEGSTRVGTRSDSVHEDRERLHEAVTRARAEAEGTNRSATRGANRSSGHAQARGTQESTAQAQGEHHDEHHDWSRQRQQGTSKTYKQTLVPRTAWRRVIQTIEWYSPDQLNLITASEIAGLQIGEAFLYAAGRPPVRVHIVLQRDPYRLTPKYASKQEAAYVAELHQCPEYVPTQLIQEERERFLQALIRNVQEALQHQHQAQIPLVGGREVLVIDESSPLAI